jgi:hypothetical protein
VIGCTCNQDFGRINPLSAYQPIVRFFHLFGCHDCKGRWSPRTLTDSPDAGVAQDVNDFFDARMRINPCLNTLKHLADTPIEFVESFAKRDEIALDKRWQ